MKPVAEHQESVELNEQQQLAETIRVACIQAALAGYEDASISGLCHEGAWECAIDAIRSLNINAIIEQAEPNLRDNSTREPG